MPQHERGRRAVAEGESPLATAHAGEAPATEAVGTAATWRRLVRMDRRRRLRRALDGTSADRWDYSVARVLQPAQEALLMWGTTGGFDPRRAAQQARRHFYRLERIARGRMEGH